MDVHELRERLHKARKRIEAKDAEIRRLRSMLAPGRRGDDPAGIRAEQIVWIFGSGRTGSTWLGRMLGEPPGSAMWNEPAVGALFGEFYYERFAGRRGRAFVMAEAHESVWLRAVRSVVLEGAAARFPDLAPAGHLAIKEPHGTVGAPLLAKAVPESRMTLLVRDPRDVVASAFEAHSTGSWPRQAREDASRATRAERHPQSFAGARARAYLWDLQKASEAYAAHEAPKALVRYEDLRRDTPEALRALCASLELDVDPDELSRTVDAHAWEAIPDDEKGEGKFYRKATPGSWREDLSPEQQRLVQEIARPVLDTFYPGWERDGEAESPSPDAPQRFAGLDVGVRPTLPRSMVFAVGVAVGLVSQFDQEIARQLVEDPLVALGEDVSQVAGDALPEL
jgi:hypothetical protein